MGRRELLYPRKREVDGDGSGCDRCQRRARWEPERGARGAITYKKTRMPAVTRILRLVLPHALRARTLPESQTSLSVTSSHDFSFGFTGDMVSSRAAYDEIQSRTEYLFFARSPHDARLCQPKLWNDTVSAQSNVAPAARRVDYKLSNPQPGYRRRGNT